MAAAHDGDSLFDEPFQRRSATGALLRAVETLCQDTGRTLDQMELLTLGEIFDIAQDAYGEALPEYWRVWQDWQRPEPPPVLPPRD